MTLHHMGRQALLAAGVTLVVWLLMGLFVGVVTVTDSTTALDVAVVVGSVIPAGVGAWFGANRVIHDLGHGLAAAAVGLSGALLVVVVFAVLGNIGGEQAGLMPTVVWPLIGGLAGAWFGGVRH